MKLLVSGILVMQEQLGVREKSFSELSWRLESAFLHTSCLSPGRHILRDPNNHYTYILAEHRKVKSFWGKCSILVTELSAVFLPHQFRLTDRSSVVMLRSV